MEKTSTWQKAAALLLFSSAIVVFVAYRAGAFDNQQTPTGYKSETNLPDSPEVKKPVIMHSTKSAPIQLNERPANEPVRKPDSTAKKPEKPRTVFMGGSKSIRMHQPRYTPDSVKEKQSSKTSNPGVKTQPEKNANGPVIIPSTKSDKIFDPNH